VFLVWFGFGAGFIAGMLVAVMLAIWFVNRNRIKPGAPPR
jgi:hypothetical protein